MICQKLSLVSIWKEDYQKVRGQPLFNTEVKKKIIPDDSLI